ncbi:MAG: TM1812 family CRISPR-associated protein [Nitrososphaeria archaeon]
MRGYIFQVVGRFDYPQVDFVIEGEEHSSSLSSKAVKDFYVKCQEERYNYKIIFLVPESLVVKLDGFDHLSLLRDRVKFKAQVKERIDELVGEPINLEDIVVLQSVGKYKEKDFSIAFENHADNLVSYMLLELSKIIDENNDGNIKLIGDISTGHNIYTTALMDTLRILIIRFKLRRLIQAQPFPNAQLIFIPPIIPGVKKYEVNFYKYDVRVFFDFPLKDVNFSAINFLDTKVTEGCKKNWGMELNEKNTVIKKMVNDAKFAFNILKYNTPLAFFDKRIINLEGENPSDGFECLSFLLKYFEDKRKLSIENSLLKEEYLKVNRSLAVNVMLSLDLLSSLRKFWEEKILPSNENSKVDITAIQKVFPETYQTLGLNKRFLLRDLGEIKELSYKLLKGEEKNLKELFTENQKEKVHLEKKISEQKRNFFAHSGFLRELVQVSKEKDRIFLRYNEKEETIKMIKSWIESPEK